MLYRMKKNAASLVNICIFSTMVIITVVCTVSLWAGEDEAIQFFNPYDCRYSFQGADRGVISEFEEEMEQLAGKNHVRITETVDYVYLFISRRNLRHFRSIRKKRRLWQAGCIIWYSGTKRRFVR